MGRWLEIYKEIIPKDKYSLKVRCGEEDGVIVELKSLDYYISIDFGSVSAIRVLDEGLVMQRVADESEMEMFKGGGFENTIYKCLDGAFGNTIKNMYGELYDILKFQHYIIVSQNYIVEVVTQWTPQIEVLRSFGKP